TLDEHLTVVLLDRTDELEEVALGIARENPSLDCVRLGRRDLAARLGIAESLLEISPYAIYLHLLGQKTPESNLAPEAITVGYRRYRARRAVYAACGALAAGGVLWAGANLYQVIVVQGETQDAARQTMQLTQ